MSRAKLQAAIAYWKAREGAAYRAWRAAVRTRPASSPTRASLFAAYEHAHTMRLDRQRDLPKLKPSNITGVDQAGLDFIANHEGVIPYVYLDSRGFATAWIGHLIRQGPIQAGDYEKWGSKQHPASRAQCLAYFKNDLKPYEAAVAQVFRGAKLLANQDRFNAAVSMTFNIGINGMLTSTFAKRVKAGDAKGAQAAMLMWNQPPEIRGRRQDEANLFGS